MKRILSLATACLCWALSVGAQGKQDVSVLYVGGSADMETMGVSGIDSVALAKSVKARMASFEKFLKARFKVAKVVDGKEYTAAMSDGYDVTVFDGRPNPIRPEVREYDKNGRLVRFERPAYLPDDFDRPALCIANFSEEIGRSIGTKCDWFCLCLDNEAHHWVKDHPIFQGPFRVDIRPEMQPTPLAAYEYAKIYGYTLPEQTEMWTVQTPKLAAGSRYRIGMVSRPEGFLDSPEAEIISSGTCAKSIDAVAIGRHGNFFHWGFSASPKYLTKAGQAVLANSIVYISKFAGKPIIARKLNETIATRSHVDMMSYLASRTAWEESNRMNQEFYAMMDSVKRVATAKQQRGEKLTGDEKMYADMPLTPPKAPTYPEYMKQKFPDLYHVFGDDAEEYQRFYQKNRGWFYPTQEGYSLDIDEDVRALGVANNDIRMLELCIGLLEKGEDAALAYRILHRYTLCRFATPGEWRKWFTTYRDKLFFTESGGWLWLVDTQGKDVPGNDYRVLRAQVDVSASAKSGQEQETDAKNPVALSASVRSLADGTRELQIRMTVHDGYHTYAKVAEEDPFIVTEMSIELPKGYQLEGELQTPAFTRLGETNTMAYVGTGVFRQRVSGAGGGEAVCTVKYQCCDASICFPPVEKVLTVKLP